MRAADNVISTTLLFCSEAALLWVFVIGLLWIVRRLVPQLRTNFFHLPFVSERFLVRFCVWQIGFVAMWSMVFKAVLPRSAEHVLSSGGSQIYANAAEILMSLLIMLGAVVLVRRGVRRA